MPQKKELFFKMKNLFGLMLLFQILSNINTGILPKWLEPFFNLPPKIPYNPPNTDNRNEKDERFYPPLDPNNFETDCNDIDKPSQVHPNRWPRPIPGTCSDKPYDDNPTAPVERWWERESNR
jgi:hypothetical protein